MWVSWCRTSSAVAPGVKNSSISDMLEFATLPRFSPSAAPGVSSTLPSASVGPISPSGTTARPRSPAVALDSLSAALVLLLSGFAPRCAPWFPKRSSGTNTGAANTQTAYERRAPQRQRYHTYVSTREHEIRWITHTQETVAQVLLLDAVVVCGSLLVPARRRRDMQL